MAAAAATSRRLQAVAATLAVLLAWALGCATAFAQQPGGTALPPVTISSKANTDPVEKSYRKMVRGMELFERLKSVAPAAQLRFRLLPRKPDSDLRNIELYILGSTVEVPVAIAPDNTFTLPRIAKAVDENALVIPNRKALTMTWRTDIRTPGLPSNVRRLGDLRLECEVGIEAGLVSNVRSVFDEIANALTNPVFCKRNPARYYFFADRPVFSVTLVNGARRESLPLDELYAGASDNPRLREELPYCDCEVLLDRTYYLPLGDRSWPDDTLVEFDYMEEGKR